MKKINNNSEIGKIQPKPMGGAKEESAKLDAEEKQMQTTFDNPKAESLGRSQVKTPDNVKKDVEFILKNPKLAEKSNKFFDMVLKEFEKQGKPDAYERAAELTGAFVEELLSN